jgi:hypothetical protein
MRRIMGAATLGMLLGLPATAEERRELDAHQHGHSTLAIAVEGNRVSIELTAPGMDIVGFEHATETPEQRDTVEKAQTYLSDPLALFVLPGVAGCRLTAADVELESEEAHADEHEEHADHTEFHATYALDCSDPVELTSISFAYFDRFPGAEEVEVTLLTERGQSSYEVTRAAPRLAIDASM